MNKVVKLPEASADAQVLWRTTIAGVMGHSFWFDVPQQRLLMSDGFGVSFAALKLRALALDDGREVASTRLGNAARAMTLASDGSLLVGTDKKLFQLAGADLSLQAKWTVRIPSYSNHLLVDDSFVYFSGGAPAVSALSLESGAVKRRVLPAKRVRIHKGISGKSAIVAVCEDGSIWDAASGLATAPRNITRTSALSDSAMDDLGQLWLSLGGEWREEGRRVFRSAPSSRLLRLDLTAGEVAEGDEYDLGLKFWKIFASSDGRTLAVIGMQADQDSSGGDQPVWRGTTVARFDARSLKCMSWVGVPEGFEVEAVCAELGLGVASRPQDSTSDSNKDKQNCAELICFKC